MLRHHRGALMLKNLVSRQDRPHAIVAQSQQAIAGFFIDGYLVLAVLHIKPI